jgi:hypothetical protein
MIATVIVTAPVYAYGILGNTVLFEEKQTQGPSGLLAD